MYTEVTYNMALSKAANMAPTLDKPTEFLKWAEDIVQLIAFIYQEDYDKVTHGLIEVIQEAED